MPTFTPTDLQDPRRTFDSPEAVLRSDRLRPQEKRDILERWRRLSQPGHAAEPPDLVTRILRALAHLDTETGAHEEIEAQGLYGSIGDIGRQPADTPPLGKPSAKPH